MLVLTRKLHQSLFIGGEIRVTVLEVRGEQVRLGIEAPRSVAVQREEVIRDLALTNQEACASCRQNSPVLLERLAGSLQVHS